MVKPVNRDPVAFYLEEQVLGGSGAGFIAFVLICGTGFAIFLALIAPALVAPTILLGWMCISQLLCWSIFLNRRRRLIARKPVDPA